MTRSRVVGGAFASLLAVLALALVVGRRAPEQNLELEQAALPTLGYSNGEAHEGLLYGRVTTDDGETYQGRLRWGGDEEALWGNYFNGFKDENPWVSQAPSEALPKERQSFGIFGFEIFGWDNQMDLGRPFMARFGDIARIDPQGRVFRVTLKSGTVFTLDRFSADDLADGIRVWDEGGNVVDIGEWKIRTIELLPTERLGPAPQPLHGTVRTAHGDFTGFIQWDRQACLNSDELHGHTGDGGISLRFSDINSITRHSGESSLVGLLDGREIVLSGTREVGQGNRGIYVDDGRYGRVLVSWDAFERVDFSPGGTGPAYDDFLPGHPLSGTVITKSGRRIAGRLVYDLDESETTETLDAPWQGVDYTIPFSLVASIVPPGTEESGAQQARVTLNSGEELPLVGDGDLGEQNAGMLVFFDAHQSPEYIPWADVERIDFAPPPAM